MSGGVTQDSLESASERAKAAGMTVVTPRSNQLLLDLDDDAALERYEKLRGALTENFGSYEAERWRSKSGNGWHVVINCACGMPAIERLALQAALGSDGLRELLGVACLRNGVKEPSVLFRPKAEAAPVAVAAEEELPW